MGPGQYPQYTRALYGGEAVGSSPSETTEHTSVTSKEPNRNLETVKSRKTGQKYVRTKTKTILHVFCFCFVSHVFPCFFFFSLFLLAQTQGPRRVEPRVEPPRVEPPRSPKGGAPKGGAPEGWGPEGWGPEGWGAPNVALFSLSRHIFHSFFPHLGWRPPRGIPNVHT